jgi:TetR/AcrR family acrAB operon transcriptional repressor
MVRKTKEEALQTRCSILDAAEHLFLAQGVSGTSLHDIALAAGVTRGAVYWHFKDKSDLFNAMMARVCLPIEESGTTLGRDGGPAPLVSLRQHLLGVLQRVVEDAQVRRVFEIATHKVEYVDELTKVRERHLEMRRDYMQVLERTLKSAQRLGQLQRQPPARQIAIGLHALLDGLIQNWMLDPAAFDLQRVGARALDCQLAGLATPPLSWPAAPVPALVPSAPPAPPALPALPATPAQRAPRASPARLRRKAAAPA